MQFEYRLARELGMTRAEVLTRISQSEFTDWLAMQSIDPFFDGWQANAINCQVTAAAAGSKVDANRFLPIKVARRPQSEAELKSSMRAFVVRR